MILTTSSGGSVVVDGKGSQRYRSFAGDTPGLLTRNEILVLKLKLKSDITTKTVFPGMFMLVMQSI